MVLKSTNARLDELQQKLTDPGPELPANGNAGETDLSEDVF